MEHLEQEIDTKTFNTEEFAKKLIDMANNFDAKDYKKNALKELDDLEEKGTHIPYSAFIIHNYPEFNHIELKVTQPNIFVIKICINPEAIKENPQMAYGLAQTYQSFFNMGARQEDEDDR